MANIDAAFGLKPLRYADGKPYNGASNKYYINASYGTALFIGDPVVRVAGGSNAAVVKSGLASYDIGTLPEVEKATAGDGNAITGVIVGFEPRPSNEEQGRYSPASTEGVALVADATDLIFAIQADGAVAAASVGLNAVLIYTNSGSTVTGISGVELDTSCDAPAADASNQLTILRVSKDVERNDVSSANTVVEVRINNHTEAHGVIGI